MSKTNIIGMAVKNKGGGMVSSAGLVTYYDSEDKRSLHISPKLVLVFAAAIGIIIAVLNHIF
jgi:preprotein translocase subunit Sec61beta